MEHQGLRRGDAAASPVMGALLMVAITMVVAATAWFVVSGLGEKTEAAPLVSFRLDQVNERIVILRVEPGVDWFVHLAIQGTCQGQATLNDGPLPDEPGEPVRVGDVLSGCDDGQSLRIIATKPNQLLFEATF